MFRFLALPVIAAIAAALAFLVAWRYLPGGAIALDATGAGWAALAIGAVVLALYCYVAFVRLGARLTARTEGFVLFEADMRRRLARIEAALGKDGIARPGTGTGDAEIEARQHEAPGESEAGAETPSEDEAEVSDKVIRFDPGARSKTPHVPQARLTGAKLAEALEKDAIEAWFQPVVTLPGRKTRYFEAIAHVTGMEGADAARRIEPAYSTAPEIDSRTLVQSLRLLRELERNGKHAGVIWRLHEAALGDVHAFAGLERILEANAALADQLIARIEHREYCALDAAQIDRLHRLRELGFKLALANCPDAAKASEALKSALFSVFMIDISRIVAETGDSRPVHRAVLGQRSRPHIEIIASGVSEEQQAMTLIDQDILLAQGNFFSEPRPLRRNVGEASSAEM